MNSVDAPSCASSPRRTPRWPLLSTALVTTLLGGTLFGCEPQYAAGTALADLQQRKISGIFSPLNDGTYRTVITLNYARGGDGQSSGGSACARLTPDATAALNGNVLDGHAGFPLRDGTCVLPRFEWEVDKLPTTPAAHMVLHDSSTDIVADFDNLFGPRTMSVHGDTTSTTAATTAVATAPLTMGTQVTLDLSPAEGITDAELDFTRTGDLYASFTLNKAALTIQGGSVSFTVPNIKAGNGTLTLWTLGPVVASTCSGAVSCSMDAVYAHDLGVTVASP